MFLPHIVRGSNHLDTTFVERKLRAVSGKVLACLKAAGEEDITCCFALRSLWLRKKTATYEYPLHLHLTTPGPTVNDLSNNAEVNYNPDFILTALKNCKRAERWPNSLDAWLQPLSTWPDRIGQQHARQTSEAWRSNRGTNNPRHPPADKPTSPVTPQRPEHSPPPITFGLRPTTTPRTGTTEIKPPTVGDLHATIQDTMKEIWSKDGLKVQLMELMANTGFGS